MKSKTPFYIQTIIIIVLAVLLIKFYNNKNKVNSDFEESPNKLSLKLADDMEELYKKYQYAIINDSLDITDHREYWFSLKELKSYINYIENKADSLNYNENTLGIRVYNAAKQEGDKIKSSIFMIGTYNNYKNKSSEASFNFLNLTKVNTLYRLENKNMEIAGFNYGSSGEPPVEFSAR